MFACLANLGLPGLSGFVAETAVYYGSFTSVMVSNMVHAVVAKPAVIFSIFGMILTLGYMLWLLKRLFFGPETRDWAGHFSDATVNEKIVAWSLSIVVLVLGICPLMLASQYNNAAEAITNMLTAQVNNPGRGRLWIENPPIRSIKCALGFTSCSRDYIHKI